MTWDLYLFEKINGLAGRWPLLDWSGIFLAEWLGYFLIVMLIIMLFYPRERQKENRLLVPFALFAALMSRFAVTAAIRLVYHHPRPFMVLADAHRLIDGNHGEEMTSFPSGHAAFFFALAVAVWLMDRGVGRFLLVAAALIGIARIFCGVHWPSDIIGGAVIGTAVAMALWKARRLPKQVSNIK